MDLTNASKIIGERLRQIREAMRKSISEAATEAGVAPETLLKIEDGKADLRILTLWRLCKVYNVTLGEVLEDF
jgi:transcriptional regulator with XRE-family HTH domain